MAIAIGEGTFMKKGFVVYFDNCRRVNRLPDGMCAAVWRLVSTYAQYVAEGQDAETWLEEQLAALPPEAAMAAEFMTDTARRDDQRYNIRKEQYIAAQRRRQETGSEGDMAKYVRDLHREKRKEIGDDTWK